MTVALTHRLLGTNGIRLHVAEAGEGPLVVLLHGFPGCWYSWRHQLVSLAEAGFHAVAPDQRGYGRSDRPDAVEAYTILHLAGDVTGLIRALGEDRAVVVGHDWGAQVAWATAQFRPDLVRGVAGLSVPHRPRADRPPLPELRKKLGDGFYMVYFQQPGPADTELARDPRDTVRRLLPGLSGGGRQGQAIVPGDGGLLDLYPAPDKLPGWLTEADLDAYAAEFAGGFTGGLNWYRNLDRNWELTAPWHDAPVLSPALYLVGEREPVTGTRLPGKDAVPHLREPLTLPGVGHWPQEEAPQSVSAALAGFADSVQGDP